VDLGFVDFRTLQSRRRACEDEVRLNRRLAPDVYVDLDVLVDGSGAQVEHVVVMRRMPEETRLSSLVTRHEDVGEHLRRLARLLADFHARCPVSPDGSRVAGTERLRELWTIGLDALAAGPPEVVPPGAVDEARGRVSAFLAGRQPLIDGRIARGLVRDGHGDLLADDIFCLADGPRVLDCLDFDADLRHGDVLGDIATLVMDLERLGAPAAARRFLDEYAEHSAEHHPDALEHLYVAYRAQVRAKVALVRAGQTSDPAVRAEQRRQAALLVQMMLAHLRRTAVRLVLVGGLPGSGKTTVAEGLSQRTGCLVHSSDLVRQELQIPRPERYSPTSVQRVYDVLLERAEAGLRQGWDVVLDASWTGAACREQARALARSTHSELVELECRVPDDTAEARLAGRPADHPSDADPSVRRQLDRAAHLWPTAHPVDTSGTPDDALAQALSVLESRS
jgi:uncharacterized protein